MRDRVFLQGRVTVVAILFRSVLTAHALFHTNEDPMRVLLLNPPPHPPCVRACHSSGTCSRLMDPLKGVVRGPTIPGPASFESWYEIPSEPVDRFSDLPGRQLGKVKDRFNVCWAKRECLWIKWKLQKMHRTTSCEFFRSSTTVCMHQLGHS